MSKIQKIIILAFLLRVFLIPLAVHSDIVNYYWWAKDLYQNGLLNFYDRGIANAMPPTYPPVTTYVFWLSAHIHQLLLKFFWVLNIKIPLFPSNFIFWFESERGWYFINKLPAILADLGIIFLIYKFVTKIENSSNKGIFCASIFAFIPFFWYNSAVWGQTDSLYVLPLFLAFYELYKGNKKTSFIFYVLSFLTKPTVLFVFPIYILWLLKNTKIKDYFFSFINSIFLIMFLYLPFHRGNLFLWMFNLYKDSLGGELNVVVANAFNFWGLVFGFNNLPESIRFLGIPSNILGYLVYLGIAVWLSWNFWIRKITVDRAFYFSVINSFAAFLFLTRMHERYFYPTLLFFIPLLVRDKHFKHAFYILSGIGLINLYHFWWFPRVNFLVNIFSNSFIEKVLILLNLAIFIFLIKKIKKFGLKTI